MTREQLIAEIWKYHSPHVGPGTTMEDVREMDRRQQAWLAAAPPEWLDLVLEIAASSTWTRDNEWLECAVEDLLERWGCLDPPRFFDRIRPYFDSESARPVLINVVSALRHPDGVRELEAILHRYNLSDAELISVASALWEIGGAEALRLLERMQQTVSPDRVEVQREIAHSLGALRNGTPHDTIEPYRPSDYYD